MVTKLSGIFLLCLLIGLGIGCSKKKPSPKRVFDTKDVRVEIGWQGNNFPLEMKIHEMKPGVKPVLWQTGIVAKTEPAPIGDEIPEGVFAMQHGREKYFVLVVHNTTQKHVSFFAAPHQVHPPEHALGFNFKCLCVNHVFQIPAGATWYRVVRLRLAKEYKSNEMKITHILIGVDKQTGTGFEFGKVEPDG